MIGAFLTRHDDVHPTDLCLSIRMVSAISRGGDLHIAEGEIYI